MWIEGLQSFYAPAIALLIFMFVINKNKVMEKRIRVLFFIQVAMTMMLMLAGWLDRCLSVLDLNGYAYKLRIMTSLLNFVFSPCCPLLLIYIYKKVQFKEKKDFLYLIPVIFNTIICLISLFTGWVFTIDANNVYSRGPLFLVPFIISAIYIVCLIYLSSKQENRPDEKIETVLIVSIVFAVTTAYILEVALTSHFLIWSTVGVCTLLYYMELVFQAIMYDSLTGVFSRAAYQIALEKGDKANGAIAVIDINELKKINDELGHDAGDKAIKKVSSSLLKYKSSKMKVYRYGGDEFVIISKNKNKAELEAVLIKANSSLQRKNKLVDFSYGVVEFDALDVLSEKMKEADHEMYLFKEKIKSKTITKNSIIE